MDKLDGGVDAVKLAIETLDAMPEATDKQIAKLVEDRFLEFFEKRAALVHLDRTTYTVVFVLRTTGVRLEDTSFALITRRTYILRGPNWGTSSQAASCFPLAFGGLRWMLTTSAS